MEKLLKWVINFNDSLHEESTFTKKLDEYDLAYLAKQYTDTLRNLFCERTNKKDYTNYPLRPSMLGKPAILIAYNYYHPSSNTTLMSNVAMRRIAMGYLFEQWVATQMIRLGYSVQQNVEKSIDIKGVTIDCHIDLLITDNEGNSSIIECKELGDWYFKNWYDEKYGNPDDDRGYITQASLYSHAFKLPVIWILGNRAEGSIGYKILNNEKDCYMNRVEKLIDVIVNKTSSWEECFQYIQPEPPNRTKKGLSVPFNMKPIANIVYELNDKGYVLDYKYPKEYLKYKPAL